VQVIQHILEKQNKMYEAAMLHFSLRREKNRVEKCELLFF